MDVEHDSDGRPVVTRYDHGDLVTLLQDEPGPLGTGKRGDWGAVERVGRFGALTVRLAGYSRPRSSPIVRLTDVPAAAVAPCDRHGFPMRLRGVPPLRKRVAPTPVAMRRGWWPSATLLVALVGGLACAVLLVLR